MNKLVLFALAVFALSSYAGVPTVLNSKEAQEFGIKLKPWDSYSQYDIKEHKENSDCVYFKIEFPQSPPEHPGTKYFHITGGISLNDKVITWLDFPILKDSDNTKYTHACLPLSEGFIVGISFKFDYGNGGMCQPTYTIPNIRNYLEETGMYKEL